MTFYGLLGCIGGARKERTERNGGEENEADY